MSSDEENRMISKIKDLIKEYCAKESKKISQEIDALQDKVRDLSRDVEARDKKREASDKDMKSDIFDVIKKADAAQQKSLKQTESTLIRLIGKGGGFFSTERSIRECLTDLQADMKSCFGSAEKKADQHLNTLLSSNNESKSYIQGLIGEGGSEPALGTLQGRLSLILKQLGDRSTRAEAQHNVLTGNIAGLSELIKECDSRSRSDAALLQQLIGTVEEGSLFDELKKLDVSVEKLRENAYAALNNEDLQREYAKTTESFSRQREQLKGCIDESKREFAERIEALRQSVQVSIGEIEQTTDTIRLECANLMVQLKDKIDEYNREYLKYQDMKTELDKDDERRKRDWCVEKKNIVEELTALRSEKASWHTEKQDLEEENRKLKRLLEENGISDD